MSADDRPPVADLSAAASCRRSGAGHAPSPPATAPRGLAGPAFAVLAVAALLVAALLVAALLVAAVPGAAEPLPDDSPTAAWVQPVRRPVVDLFRRPSSEWGAGNRGWEYATRPGDVVVSVGGGVVTFAGPVAGRGVVSVVHPGGLVSSLTGLERVDVAAGDLVRAGQSVGTARAGLHLGFRLRGVYVDPAEIFGGRLHAVLVPLPR